MARGGDRGNECGGRRGRSRELRHRGRIAALRGDHDQGLEPAQRAVELAEQTDFFEVQANMYIEHGHVLALAGRRDEAVAAYERALAVARDKGATAWEAKIEALLAEL